MSDYEHGAAFYGLEPEFIANVRRADVIFLGESKLQTAVSAPPVAAYFRAKGLRFFAFRFGFGETAPFSLMLLHQKCAALLASIDGRRAVDMVHQCNILTGVPNPSADRWSAALMRLLDPLLDRCRAH